VFVVLTLLAGAVASKVLTNPPTTSTDVANMPYSPPDCTSATTASAAPTSFFPAVTGNDAPTHCALAAPSLASVGVDGLSFSTNDRVGAVASNALKWCDVKN
jgi:hypothetical protein